MAAIAAVNMEPQWPLHQPFVPYVYGAYYPAYHQVRVVPVVPKTKSVAPKKPISLKPKTYSLDYLSSEGCEVVDFIERELSKWSDFQNGRLPTLAFEIWSTKEGIRHSYYEKPMRNQVLTMKRS